MAQTLARAVHAELVVRKSQFLGCVQPMDGRAGALRVVERLRAEHPRATHVCWALLAGGESAAVDDGEPAGTAGLPMLAVLRKQDLDQVLATVVRYFGGIKLGAGGLVRAYTDTVARALADADKVAIVTWLRLGCTLPYPLEGVLRHALEGEPVRHVALQYGEHVHLGLEVDSSHTVALRARLDDLAHGRLLWDDTDPADG